LTSLPAASLLTARELWERWVALGKPVRFDFKQYTEDSRAPFQRYKSFAAVAALLAQSSSAEDPIDVLDRYLRGGVVCVRARVP
jgi:hypothetical protein